MPNIHASMEDELKHMVNHPNFLLLYVKAAKLCSYECKRVSVRGKKTIFSHIILIITSFTSGLEAINHFF